MFKRIHIVKKINATDDPTVRSIESVIERAAFNGHGIPIVNQAQVNSETLVIAVGGDGTMLEAMRIAYRKNATATGINLGQVGFLTDFPNTNNFDFLDSIEYLFDSPENHPIEERIGLHAWIVNKDKSLSILNNEENPFIAFNEFVMSNKLSDDLIKYNLHIGDRCAGSHRANALIVGTPTGSTAYSLSAGGSLLLPTMEAMQIVPVAPISLTSRPIIIPSDQDLRIKIDSHVGLWQLKADGVPCMDIATPHTICIGQADRKVKIIHTQNWSFFNMLTEKLGWNT